MVESDTCIRPINPREENARIHPTHAHLIPLATQNRLLGIKDPYMVSEEAKKLEAEKAKLSHWQVRTNNDKSIKENENSTHANNPATLRNPAGCQRAEPIP